MTGSLVLDETYGGITCVLLLCRNSLKYNFFYYFDVLASTDAFVGMVCLIAIHHSVLGEQVVIDVGELGRPLVSVPRIVLFLPDMYHLLDPSVHSVAFSVDDFGLIPICDVVERDSVFQCSDEGFSRSRNVNNNNVFLNTG